MSPVGPVGGQRARLQLAGVRGSLGGPCRRNPFVLRESDAFDIGGVDFPPRYSLSATHYFPTPCNPLSPSSAGPMSARAACLTGWRDAAFPSCTTSRG